jgi:hypothetical protein
MFRYADKYIEFEIPNGYWATQHDTNITYREGIENEPVVNEEDILIWECFPRDESIFTQTFGPVGPMIGVRIISPDRTCYAINASRFPVDQNSVFLPLIPFFHHITIQNQDSVVIEKGFITGIEVNGVGFFGKEFVVFIPHQKYTLRITLVCDTRSQLKDFLPYMESITIKEKTVLPLLNDIERKNQCELDELVVFFRETLDWSVEQTLTRMDFARDQMEEGGFYWNEGGWIGFVTYIVFRERCRHDTNLRRKFHLDIGSDEIKEKLDEILLTEKMWHNGWGTCRNMSSDDWHDVRQKIKLLFDSYR